MWWRKVYALSITKTSINSYTWNLENVRLVWFRSFQKNPKMYSLVCEEFILITLPVKKKNVKFFRESTRTIKWLFTGRKREQFSIGWPKSIAGDLSLRDTVMYQSNRSLNIPPRAYPGHLTSFPAREGGNLMNLVFPGAGNLIASLDFMFRVALIPRGVIWSDKSWRSQLMISKLKMFDL